VSIERRYFISSLGVNVENFARAVRKHWMIESMHWELDVVFGEDANQTLDQIAVQNLNILRKLCLSILKYLQFDKPKSLRRKRFALQLMLPEYMEKLFSL
jgi:predicted transposase YbfD/YdcC